jgi:hypothetical protein
MRNLTKRKQALTLLAVSGALTMGCQVHAAVLFDTSTATFLPPNGTLTDQPVTSGLWVGQSFIVPDGGAGADQWNIDTIKLQLGAGSDASGNFLVSIYGNHTVDQGVLGINNAPDTLSGIIGALSGSTDPTTKTLYTYTPTPGGAGSLTLNAGIYWVVAGVTSGSGNYIWTYTSVTGPADPNPPAVNHTESVIGIGNLQGPLNFQNGNFSNGGLDQTPSIMQINGTVVPEPSIYGLLAGLGLLGFAGWRRYCRK